MLNPRPEQDTFDLTTALRDGVARLTTSTEWERYLAFQAAFHDYSFGNVVLIAAQCPGATRVAGYSTWRRFGRWVRRGERAIWILAPVRRPRAAPPSGDEFNDRDELESRIVRFRRVAVFDISQTDGMPPPEIVHRLTSGEGCPEYATFVTYASDLGYAVLDRDLGAWSERRV